MEDVLESQRIPLDYTFYQISRLKIKKNRFIRNFQIYEMIINQLDSAVLQRMIFFETLSSDLYLIKEKSWKNINSYLY